MNISLNQEQQLFCIHTEDGLSCLGFQNCFDHTVQLARMLRRSDLLPQRSDIGTIGQYQLYQRLLEIASTRDLGTWFDPGTTRAVRNILAIGIGTQRTFRLFYGDPEAGRDWLEEHDVIGTLGRSSGVLKCPLLIEPGASGGPAILTKCIVKIMVHDEDFDAWHTLYEHQLYHQPTLTFARNELFEVYADEQLYSRHSSRSDALRTIQFLKGERMDH